MTPLSLGFVCMKAQTNLPDSWLELAELCCCCFRSSSGFYFSQTSLFRKTVPFLLAQKTYRTPLTVNVLVCRSKTKISLLECMLLPPFAISYWYWCQISITLLIHAGALKGLACQFDMTVIAWISCFLALPFASLWLFYVEIMVHFNMNKLQSVVQEALNPKFCETDTAMQWIYT